MSPHPVGDNLLIMKSPVLGQVTSGGATINDSFTHASVPTLPFGGIGESGTGAYHGKLSYETFTHRRTVAEVPGWMEKLLRVRYLPYDQAQLARFRWMNGSKPDFDRDGNQLQGLSYWTWMLLGLGGPSAKGALLRWLVIASGVYLYSTYGAQLGQGGGSGLLALLKSYLPSRSA